MRAVKFCSIEILLFLTGGTNTLSCIVVVEMVVFMCDLCQLPLVFEYRSSITRDRVSVEGRILAAEPSAIKPDHINC